MRGLNQHFKRAGNKNTPSGGEGSDSAAETVISRRGEGVGEKGKEGGEGGEEEEGGVFRCADWKVCVRIGICIFVCECSVCLSVWVFVFVQGAIVLAEMTDLIAICSRRTCS